uniref:Spermatosis associated 1 n=1 Tax=Salvator merianae TaxID=96440 RepID=A0A8D0E5I6_SALMN
MWNFKLNTVPIDHISTFFSAGFIRVLPHMTLRTLREQLGEHLGEDAVVDKYIFLKCIGKKLAVVKSKQETELKLKLFAPPYAPYPELYLLPGIENTYSSTSPTPERHPSNKEYMFACTPCQEPQSLVAPNSEVRQSSEIWGSTLKNHLSHIQEKNNLLEWNETEKEHVTFLPTTTSCEQEENAGRKKYNSQTREVLCFVSTGTELHKQLQHIKIERKRLEWSREELIKNVKGLIEQNKLKRYNARDSWKKKYFEVKKVTVSLEEILNKLREDLDLHYQKLLVQLQARDIRKRNNITKTNNTIIQITTLQHEIDQLRRQLDNAKMKLIIEIKMRKQATSDLQALRAELAHKKIQASFKLQKPIKRVP